MTHLELLNIVLAWAIEQPGWPPVLLQSDYLVHSVGVGLQLPGGRGRVAPDVVAVCAARDLTLLVEVKSRKNVEEDQLKSMLALTPTDLRDLNYLPVRDVSRHRILVLYLCNDVHADTISQGVSGTPAGVVSFDGKRFTLHRSIGDEVLENRLRRAVGDDDAVPLDIVPFDHESEDVVIARRVVPKLVAALTKGVAQVSVESILQQTHGYVADVMQSTGAPTEFSQLRGRVSKVLHDAARHELRPWIERVKKDRVWRFRSALSGVRSKKTRELKALQKAATKLFERLGSPEPDEIQLALFRDDFE